MKKTILFIFLFIVFYAEAQNPSFTIVNPGNLCNNGDCIALTTDYIDIKNTTDYAATSVNYNPLFSFTGGTVIDVNLDDQFTSVSLPFSFCFYGNVYQNIAIGSNGVVAFNQPSNDRMLFRLRFLMSISQSKMLFMVFIKILI
jgi:hypothetical protein